MMLHSHLLIFLSTYLLGMEGVGPPGRYRRLIDGAQYLNLARAIYVMVVYPWGTLKSMSLDRLCCQTR